MYNHLHILFKDCIYKDNMLGKKEKGRGSKTNKT